MASTSGLQLPDPYENVDDSDKDRDYVPDAESSSSEDEIIPRRNEVLVTTSSTPEKRGRKRLRKEENWKRNILKQARNTGKAYESHTATKKIRPERKLKPGCSDACKLQCSLAFNENDRTFIFNSYWDLGDIELQRQFISNCIQTVQPRYRYVRVGGTRKPRDNNRSYYFKKDGVNIRVCKQFFKNTLDINDRPIRTVIEKQNKLAGSLLENDKRGKHGHQKRVEDGIKQGISEFIESIPKIESHYTRANTSKLYIDGGKTIIDLHKDYEDHCKANRKPFGNYALFYKIFTKDFNISFFVPKKDLCEICHVYENADVTEKQGLQATYDTHQKEKRLSRLEKERDKNVTEPHVLIAVYDLQTVVQLPKGNVSLFYYKCKLNVLNFTIHDISNKISDCYVWDESNGNRGVNELGSCVFDYLTNVSDAGKTEIVFYSDNCAGQQKNKFMISMYLYAVRCLNINKITHKYLIKGHTQNEGDAVHSLIERQIKRQVRSGPMYTPESFVSAIKMAKRNGPPFKVHELNYEFFYDVKKLFSSLGCVNLGPLKINEAKIMEVRKECPNSIFYKTSYEDQEFKEVVIIKRRNINPQWKQAFAQKPGISERKKSDLMELVNKKHIPSFYKPFFENL